MDNFMMFIQVEELEGNSMCYNEFLYELEQSFYEMLDEIIKFSRTKDVIKIYEIDRVRANWDTLDKEMKDFLFEYYDIKNFLNYLYFYKGYKQATIKRRFK